MENQADDQARCEYELKRHEYIFRVNEPTIDRGAKFSTIALGGHVAALAVVFSIWREVKTSQALEALVEPASTFFAGAIFAIVSLAAAGLISYNLALWLTAVGFANFNDDKLSSSSKAHYYFASKLLGPMRIALILALCGSVGCFMWGILQVGRALPTIFGVKP